MNHHRSISMRAASLGVVLAAACTAGTDTVDSVPFPAPREPAPNAREGAGATRDNPGNDRQNPGNDRENPGNDRDRPGGATVGGSGGSTCPACDTTYDCTGVVNGQTITGTVTLQTQDGVCQIPGKGLIFNCDGTFTPTSADTAGGTWKPAGKGGFSISDGGSTLTCLPSTANPGQVSG